ncbi:hypothetical protein [Cellulomonas edaphi]|uniref:Pyrroloquinoline-quinone binding quinoprotein n=1 Tax=Cellulomonas edaphi TaxID=3053468 RepID=A0ABT7S932_9CELL|nr:hypothetical protein [Cellulomons edaphi]MDM7832118.1 hypothetical protein [Cellulomons edaphi]
MSEQDGAVRARPGWRPLAVGAGLLALGCVLCLASVSSWPAEHEPSPALWIGGVLVAAAGAGLLVVWLASARRTAPVRDRDIAVAVVVAGALAVGAVWVPWQAARPHAEGVLWSRPWSDDVHDAFPVGRSIVVVGRDSVRVLDRATGEQTARIATGAAGPRTVEDAGSGHVVIATPTGVASYSLPAGTRDWVRPSAADGSQVPVAARDGVVVLARWSSDDDGTMVHRVVALDEAGRELWARDARALSAVVGGGASAQVTARGLPAVVPLDLGSATQLADVRSGAVLETRPTSESRPLALAGDAVLWSTPARDVGACTFSLSRGGVPSWQRAGDCAASLDWVGTDRAVYTRAGAGEDDEAVVIELDDGSMCPLPGAGVRERSSRDWFAQTVSDDVVLDPTGGARVVATDPPATRWLWSVGGSPAVVRDAGEPLGPGSAAVLTDVGGLNPWFDRDAREDRADVTVMDSRTGERTGHYGAGAVLSAYATGPAQSLAVVEERVHAASRGGERQDRTRLVLLGRP